MLAVTKKANWLDVENRSKYFDSTTNYPLLSSSIVIDIDWDIYNRYPVSFWSCSDHYSEGPYWEMLSIKAPAITGRSTKVKTWASDNSIHWFSVLTRWDWVQLWQSMCSCWHLPGLLFIFKAKWIHEKQNKHLIKGEKSVFIAP